MAAYAAIVCLMNTLNNVQNHRRFSNSLDKKQVESLRERLDFLLEFIESTSTSHDSQSDEEARLVLEREIACAAFVAEDVIESHIVHHIHHAAASIISLLDLETVIQDMDSVKEKVVIAKEQRGFKDYVHPTSSASTSSSTPKSTRIVGLDDELIRLLDELTGHEVALKIIPITGMGGIGKTTLARNAYEKQLIVQHFDFRAWVTISQTYSVRDIFSKLLSCESCETGEHELQERLYQHLIGRRYLIILDDIWSIEAWHSIKRFFPNNNNRSRVVVTTRLSSIANHFSTLPFQLGFLDEEKSWQLFCENASPGEVCPRELDEIGKKVVKKCKGLPLLIVVIGALLRKSSSLKYWENISENMHSISSIEEEESLDILSLSYIHLPAHLKSCFLYMAIFLEDDKIDASILIKLWVGEGFVKPSQNQSLEEVANGYLKDLIDRNLVLHSENFFTREHCSIHDLVRDLCLKKSEKENFLCTMRVKDIRQGIDAEHCFAFNQGRVSRTTNVPIGMVESAFLARSLASNGDSKFSKLRVLDAPDSFYSEDYILKQVNLRYISMEYLNHPNQYDIISERFSVSLHSSISLLWNLQTLNMWACFINQVVAPREIWEMPQLRHVNVYPGIWLPDPSPLSNQQQDDEFVGMPNLQTLWRVVNPSEEVCKRIPNVKTLRVVYDEEYTSVKGSSIASYDFESLHKLQTLHCGFMQEPIRVDLLQKLAFPSSLQELSLECCYLHWEDLTMIGSLPHLWFLLLGDKSVIGSEWNPVEGEFISLRLLELVDCEELVNWNADNSHFPLLEKLLLHGLKDLQEIPSGLGEIPTLAEIVLNNCSESSSISAVKILDEQESYGNEGLRVQIRFGEQEKLERFKEKIQHFESSASNTLLVFQ